MKKNLLIVIVVLMSLPVLAQNTLFDQLTEEYMEVNGFSASQITEDMFDLYLKKKNIEENSPVYEALNDLDKILVISQNDFMSGTYVTAENKNKKEQEEFAGSIHKTILNYYRDNNYILFKTEKKMGEDVKVFLKKDNDIIQSLALVTHSASSANLIELQGDIDLTTVSELSKAFNLRGLENLYKINNSGYFVGSGGSVGAAVYSRERVEEMVQRQRAITEKQHTLSKEQQIALEKQAHAMAEKQMEMAEKYREMAEKYQRQPVFLNYPGNSNTIYMLNGKKVDTEEIKKVAPDQIEKIEIERGESEDDATTIKIITKK